MYLLIWMFQTLSRNFLGIPMLFLMNISPFSSFQYFFMSVEIRYFLTLQCQWNFKMFRRESFLRQVHKYCRELVYCIAMKHYAIQRCEWNQINGVWLLCCTHFDIVPTLKLENPQWEYFIYMGSRTEMAVWVLWVPILLLLVANT